MADGFPRSLGLGMWAKALSPPDPEGYMWLVGKRNRRGVPEVGLLWKLDHAGEVVAAFPRELPATNPEAWNESCDALALGADGTIWIACSWSEGQGESSSSQLELWKIV